MSLSGITPASPPSRHERPSSRSSGRSIRAPSPVLSIDSPVAVRNQISTLKHNIRQQQAQVTGLENHILRGPRPYPNLSDSMSSSTPNLTSPPPSSYSGRSPTPNGSSPTKMARRTSFEVLQGIAGPDSNLPLPIAGRRDLGHSVNGSLDDSSIKEGVPMTSPTAYKRISSPTRTLSRIPVSSVGNARALAEEGAPAPSTSSSSLLHSSIIDASLTSPTSPSLQLPPSPNTTNRRASLTPGGTTKVLADLQAGVVNARNALENTKAQLRLSQRSVASLTRQTEDLKEGRERLRLENEGLNNVVARKERLLQEVLERARKAETDATQLRSQLKSETSQSKKSLREMEVALAESTALSQKSEREYITLRESLKHLTESWKSDTERLRDEIRKREEKWKGEAETLGKKYRKLVEEVQASRKGEEVVKVLREEDRNKAKEIEDRWMKELDKMKQVVEKNEKDSKEDSETARQLSAELARLRRLMQNAGRAPTNDELDSSYTPS
ncbi:uncharacterized protein C8R40DRAFT_1111315 [Lentinula edodes]|uniref:uncharacterized protein n=1 Tax=Lentinula edodes TaxID=5353 RepID=UPI001E8D4C04|nr:uncharacterized protein C8R40DRAFT_1111315 [Lentinula edodes]KAH7874099.1 hypothetical protein C8R40DRAFT_1111315 [Lentinula edodes]